MTRGDEHDHHRSPHPDRDRADQRAGAAASSATAPMGRHLSQYTAADVARLRGSRVRSRRWPSTVPPACGSGRRSSRSSGPSVRSPVTRPCSRSRLAWRRSTCPGGRSADANLSGHTYPDQSLYPANSVPAVVRRINNAMVRATRSRGRAVRTSIIRSIRADRGRCRGRIGGPLTVRADEADDHGRGSGRSLGGSAGVGEDAVTSAAKCWSRRSSRPHAQQCQTRCRHHGHGDSGDRPQLPSEPA